MKLFGYEQGKRKLLELQEVSLQASPEELLAAAAFLTEAAHLMSVHGDSFGHIHYRDWQPENPQWKEMKSDLICVAESKCSHDAATKQLPDGRPLELAKNSSIHHSRRHDKRI